MRSILVKFALATVIPALFFLCIELACRVFLAFAPSTLAPQLLQMPTWMATDKNAQTHGTSVKVKAADLEWMSLFEEGEGYRVRLKPGLEIRLPNTFSTLPNDGEFLLKSNSLGFRGPELSKGRNPDKFRILFFGDSSTFGWGVDQDKIFTSRLETLLNGKFDGRPVEIGNFAMPGDSTAYGKLIFEKFAPEYPADIVAFGFGANDAKPAYVSHMTQVNRYRESSWLNSIVSIARYSSAYKLAEHRLRFGGSKPSGPPKTPGVAPASYRDNLISMARAAKSLGASRTMILELCTPGRYVREGIAAAESTGSLILNGQELLLNTIPELKEHRLYPDEVAALEASHLADLKKNDRFYVTSDMCHANAIGHRLLAEKMAELLLQPVPAPEK